MHIYHNFRYKESEEKKMSDLVLLFTPFKIFDLLYSRVGVGAGVDAGAGAGAAGAA
jgi:hypothetical protein